MAPPEPSTVAHRTKQEQEPARDEITELAPNILRLELPVNMPGLGHVNAWLLTGGDGVTVVDTGIPGREPWRALEAGLGRAGIGLSEVKGIVVTHSHPDHFGCVGPLAEATGAAVITHGSFQTGWDPHPHGFEVPDVDPADLPLSNPWEGPAPWGGESRASRERRDGRRWPSDFVPPRVTRRLRNGEMIRLGARQWMAVHTPGHTIDHLCLWDPEDGILISGDHVLPTITPHVPGQGAGRDPLAYFMSSLEKVAALGPTSLVLPAHGHPFPDLEARVRAILAHHEARLAEVLELAHSGGAATVTAYSHQMFRPQRWGPSAEDETYAHLQHLFLTGRLERIESGGTVLFGPLEEEKA